MAFKLLVLAAFVTIVAISHAQTTGASSGEGVGDILGLVTSIVPGPLRNIANKLVEIIKKLGDFLAGQENLDQLVSFLYRVQAGVSLGQKSFERYWCHRLRCPPDGRQTSPNSYRPLQAR